MNIKNIALLLSITAMEFLACSSWATTISGTDLSGLTYRPGSPDSQYVPAAGLTPALAALSTPDSGVNGDAPVVYVRAANVGLPTLGILDTLSASYHLFDAAIGPAGTSPYWLTYLYAPGGGYVGVVSFGGPDLNGSSQIHVFYDFDTDPNPHTTDTYFGDTLSALDSILYNGTTTFGQLGVYETGVEIGNWDNGNNTIPANANIDSITVNVPEPASSTLLLSFGLGSLLIFGYRQKRLAKAK
ncbi:MAG TPA: hypothetical protein VJ252_08215 [Chthoniobacterales bacterium]|nr:hypothetical protein [Chthoniobacterales bacterium]